MKYFLVIAWALFIDCLQASISFALMGIFAIPGAIPLIGTAIAAVSLPIGVLIGFVINVCLSLTMGSALIFLLVSLGMYYPKYLWPGSIADFIPGINNVPFWTLLAIASSIEHAKSEGKGGLVTMMAGMALAPTRGIMGLKEKTMDLPGVKESLAGARFRQERVAQPQTGGELEKTARTRTPMQDIRPVNKTYAKPA